MTETEEQRFLETIEGGLRPAGRDLRLRGHASSPARRRSGSTTPSASRSTSPRSSPRSGASRWTRGLRGGARRRSGSGRATAAAPARKHGRRPGGAPSQEPASGASVKRGKQKFVGYQTRPRPTPSCSPSARRASGSSSCCARTRSTPSRAGRSATPGGVAGQGWRCRWTRCGRTERGTVVGGAFRETFEPDAGPGGGRRRPPPQHRAQPQRHAPGARRAAQASRHPRAAAGLAGGRRPAALRLLAPRARSSPTTLRADRARGERARSGPTRRSSTREMRLSRRARARRDGVLLREVRRRGAGRADGRPRSSSAAAPTSRTTGQVGLFRFPAQGGVAAGVRRIEAVTGPGAYAALDASCEARLRAGGATLLKAQPEHLARRVEQLLGGAGASWRPGCAEVLKRGRRRRRRRTSSTMQRRRGDDRRDRRRGSGRDRADRRPVPRRDKRNAVLVLFGTAGRGAIHVALTDDLVQRGPQGGRPGQPDRRAERRQGRRPPAFRLGRRRRSGARSPAAREAAPRARRRNGWRGGVTPMPDWFDRQSDGAPPALRARAAQLPRSQPRTDDAGRRRWRPRRREALAPRLDARRATARCALDLLAADALITLALQAQADADPTGWAASPRSFAPSAAAAVIDLHSPSAARRGRRLANGGAVGAGARGDGRSRGHRGLPHAAPPPSDG